MFTSLFVLGTCKVGSCDKLGIGRFVDGGGRLTAGAT
jgi:hypothetical protein